MSVAVAAPKTSKPTKTATTTPLAASRPARFRSRAFTRELATAFHGAKLRALDVAKPKA